MVCRPPARPGHSGASRAPQRPLSDFGRPDLHRPVLLRKRSVPHAQYRQTGGGRRFTEAYCQGTYCGPPGHPSCQDTIRMPPACWDTRVRAPKSASATGSQHFPTTAIMRRVSKIFTWAYPVASRAEGTERTTPSPGTRNTTARDPSGGLPAMEKLFRKTPTVKDPWWEGTPLS